MHLFGFGIPIGFCLFFLLNAEVQPLTKWIVGALFVAAFAIPNIVPNQALPFLPPKAGALCGVWGVGRTAFALVLLLWERFSHLSL